MTGQSAAARANDLRALARAKQEQIKLGLLEGKVILRDDAQAAITALAKKAQVAILDLVRNGAAAIAREAGVDQAVAGAILEREARAVLAAMAGKHG